MGPMLRRATDRTPLNDVRPVMAKCRTAPNTLEAVRLAVQRSGLKLEYLASLCPGSKAGKAISAGQLSEAMNGTETFKLSWLDAWPDEFWNEFTPLMRHREGTTAELKEQRRRMLHATIDLLFDQAVGE